MEARSQEGNHPFPLGEIAGASPAKPGRTWAERKRRRDTIAAHLAAHGNICPGYERWPRRTLAWSSRLVACET
jgi:hypothetical protein